MRLAGSAPPVETDDPERDRARGHDRDEEADEDDLAQVGERQVLGERGDHTPATAGRIGGRSLARTLSAVTLSWRRAAAQIATRIATARAATTATPAVALEKLSTARSAAAPTRPAAGIVSTQATTMFRTTFQCTTPPARPRPAPMIPPETTWVVESE